MTRKNTEGKAIQDWQQKQDEKDIKALCEKKEKK